MSNCKGSGKMQPAGERIRKTVLWISESTQLHPEKTRRQILEEATLRFDLTPAECEFVLEKLQEAGGSD